ncbi:hypothetical protein FXW78_26360 [Rhodococcus opacus]|nr:hypothetical protein [Rhodococcus opacus]
MTQGVSGAPVVDEESRFVGTVSRAGLGSPVDAMIARLVDASAPTVALTANRDALDGLRPGDRWLTVFDAHRRVLATSVHNCSRAVWT